MMGVTYLNQIGTMLSFLAVEDAPHRHDRDSEFVHKVFVATDQQIQTSEIPPAKHTRTITRVRIIA